MDEILIGEKKYISSKQAAKITGYAKDYIGQLCREGRVPARLVGRSWYVLESAIHDHRFTDQDLKQGKKIDVGRSIFPEKENSHPSSALESPRYEAIHLHELPLVNLLKDEDSREEKDIPGQDFHDSWKAWFNHVTDFENQDNGISIPLKREETVEKKQEGVNIQIHPIIDKLPKELLPPPHSLAKFLEIEKQPEIAANQASITPVSITSSIIRGILILFAISIAAVAIVNSGKFDKYLISNWQASAISGITIYKNNSK